MTKRHFIALADSLRGSHVSDEVLNRLCDFMQSQNPAFMRGRWLAYFKGDCGPNGGTVTKKA